MNFLKFNEHILVTNNYTEEITAVRELLLSGASEVFNNLLIHFKKCNYLGPKSASMFNIIFKLYSLHFAFDLRV